MPEVGNTADTLNPLGTQPGERKFGSPHGQIKFDLSGVSEPTTSRIDLYSLSYKASTGGADQGN